MHNKVFYVSVSFWTRIIHEEWNFPCDSYMKLVLPQPVLFTSTRWESKHEIRDGSSQDIVVKTRIQWKAKTIDYWWGKQTYSSHSGTCTLCLYSASDFTYMYPRAHKCGPHRWEWMRFTWGYWKSLLIRLTARLRLYLTKISWSSAKCRTGYQGRINLCTDTGWEAAGWLPDHLKMIWVLEWTAG